MADNKDDKKVEVPESLLLSMQAQIAELQKVNEANAAAQVISQAAEGKSDAIRELVSLEEKFKKMPKVPHLRRVKLYDDKGIDKGGLVVGWTGRNSYETVNKDGVAAKIVNMIDVFFLGKPDKAVTITTDALMSGEKVKCEIVASNIIRKKHKTGEEVEVVEWTKSGAVPTGVWIDSYDERPEGSYTLKVPGVEELVTIDLRYMNA